MTERITTLGGGSFGTAMSLVLADNGHRIKMFVRNSADCQFMRANKTNPKYLKEFDLPDSLEPHSDLGACLAEVDYILFCLPSMGALQLVEKLAETLPSDKMLLTTVKGFCDSPQFLLHDYITQAFHKRGKTIRIAAISGPNIAREIAQKKHTAAVVASQDSDTAIAFQRLFANSYMSLVTTEDITGVELAGALKNIYAIAAGFIDIFDLGDNCKSMLIASAIEEMLQVVGHFGGEVSSVTGLAGVGDIITTCISPLSRNHTIGKLIAQGMGLEEAKGKISGISEGLVTLQLTAERVLPKELLESLPLINTLYKIIYGRHKPNEFIQLWLSK